MQIGISILLTFAVFKLRLSDDVPVQSDSIPLINIYFTLCISFSLTSMIWFSILNNIRERKKISKKLINFILNYICLLMCNNLDDDLEDYYLGLIGKIQFSFTLTIFLFLKRYEEEAR